MSEVIGRCGWDEKTEWRRGTGNSLTLKKYGKFTFSEYLNSLQITHGPDFLVYKHRFNHGKTTLLIKYTYITISPTKFHLSHLCRIVFVMWQIAILPLELHAI